MKKAYNFFWKKVVANKKHEEGMLRVSGFGDRSCFFVDKKNIKK